MTDRRLNALRDAHARIGMLIAAWPQVTHWIDMKDTNHPSAVAYDASGTSSGEVRDLSAYITIPNPGKRDRKALHAAVDRIVGGSIDADQIRRNNLTSTSLPPVRTDDDTCRHCGEGPRYRGDLDRFCYDWKRNNAQQLPPDYVLRTRKQGRLPRVRVVG